MGRTTWRDDDVKILKNMYSNGESIDDICSALNRSKSSIESKASKLGITKMFIRKNNADFKAVYQNYDWCYERYINRNMSHQEMADECGASLRVIQKWCSEKFNLNELTWRKHKRLTEQQKQLIMFGILGDGHIDKRETQPLFIVSHAENQKDYLYWKYNILKNVCNKQPTIYDESYKEINGKLSKCQRSYRMCTRILDDLYEIRNMKYIDIINNLNEFGLSIYLLDDGYRGKSYWELCMADYSVDEIYAFIRIAYENFNLSCHIKNNDSRYVVFNSKSSKAIDRIILNNIANDLDIIKYKILNRMEAC